LGIVDWGLGLGIGDWAQYPKPKTQNPKPKTQNPIKNFNINNNLKNIYLKIIKNIILKL